MNEDQVRQIIRDELEKLIKSDRYTFHKTLQILNGRNIIVGTGDGTKIGTESTQKLGFFGATPIIKQTADSQTPSTFVANTSGIVNDSATWGNYSIGDIVAILKAYGLLT